MKLFVAGGTGVIGRRAVPALVAEGHDVTVVARSPERDALICSMGASPVRVDLFDAAGVDGAVAGHDVVINLATHIPSMTKAAGQNAWTENDRIRTEGASNLAGAARNHGATRFIQESITFPYADGGASWIDEEFDRPASPFSAAVDHAEHAALTISGARGVVLRFAQFYAPDSDHTKTFAAAFRRRINPFLGSPDAHTALLGMEAAARAVVAALDVDAGIYNVADDDPPTRRELGTTVAAAIGRRPPRSVPAGPIRWVNKASDVLMRSHRVDTSRFRAASGWQPDHRGAEGLAAAVAAVLAADG